MTERRRFGEGTQRSGSTTRTSRQDHGLLRVMLGFVAVWGASILVFALANDGIWMYRKLLFLAVVALCTLAYLVCFWLPILITMRWRGKHRLGNYVVGALLAWIPGAAVCCLFWLPVNFASGLILAVVGGAIAHGVVERGLRPLPATSTRRGKWELP